MQKKQKVAVALVILFLFVVIGSFSLVGTFAKYTSTVEGSGEARVALWKWTINDEILANNATTFNMKLFQESQLLDSNCKDKENAVVNDAGVIAPGTCGKFAINLTNSSEVDATYAYTLSLENTSNIPLEFTTTPTEASSWKKDITLLNQTATNIARSTSSTSREIYWRWAFDRTDGNDKDTALGFGGTAEVTVKANLTLTQVDTTTPAA